MPAFRRLYDQIFSREYSHLPPAHAYWAKKVTEWNRQATRVRASYRGPWKENQKISDLEYFSIDDGLEAYNKHFSRLIVNGSLDFAELLRARALQEVQLFLLDVGSGANVAVRGAVQALGKDVLRGMGVSLGDPRTAQERRVDKQNNVIFHDADINVWQPPHHQKFDMIWSKEAIIHTLDALGNMSRMFDWLQVGGEMWVSFGNRDIAERFYNFGWMYEVSEEEFDRSALFYKQNAQAVADVLEQVFFQVPPNSEKSRYLGYTSVMYRDAVRITRLSADAKLAFPGVQFNPEYGTWMQRAVSVQNPSKGDPVNQVKGDVLQGVYVLNKANLAEFVSHLR